MRTASVLFWPPLVPTQGLHTHKKVYLELYSVPVG